MFIRISGKMEIRCTVHGVQNALADEVINKLVCGNPKKFLGI